MKMHKTLVDRIMRAYDMWGGRSDDSRLREALSQIDVSEYTGSDGRKVLVTTEDLEREKQKVLQQSREYIR